MDNNAVFGAVVLAVLVIFGYARMFLAGRGRDRLKAVLPQATVIDVRTSQEYRDGHFAGARNIPVERIGKSAGKIGDRDEPVIVYCASGSRARQAARLLRTLGFSSVHVGGSLAQMNKLTA